MVQETERNRRGDRALREAFQGEINSFEGQHPWAGVYYQGDGMGANLSLSLAPESGFVYTWHGCLGLYDHNRGMVEESTTGTIRLNRMLASQMHKELAEELIPITWGERKYLVSEVEMPLFADQVNEGREPRRGAHGRFYLRHGDDKKVTVGLPVVPEQFRPLFFQSEIIAEVMEILPAVSRTKYNRDETYIPVVLNCSDAEKLHTGMKMYVIYPDGIYGNATITSVESNRVTAEFEQRNYSTNPSVGWKLTSKHPRPDRNQ